LVVRSIVLIDFCAGQENVLPERTQLVFWQDQHPNIGVVITSGEIQMGCARRQGQQLATPAFGGSEEQRGAGVPNHVRCREREEV
jgi:hypothetical protein